MYHFCWNGLMVLASVGIVQRHCFFFEYEIVQGSCSAIVGRVAVPIDEQYCTHETGTRYYQ